MPKKIQLPAIPVIWIVLGSFLPIEAILLGLYISRPAWREPIVFGATIVGGAFALYSHMKHIDETRARYAQRLMERWNNPSPEFELWKDTLRNVYAGKLDPAKFARTRLANGEIVLPADLETRNRIVGLLGYCEEVALAIRTNNADEELIRRLLEAVLLLSWEKFKPWIDAEKETMGKPAGDELYFELQKLVEKWGG